MNFNEAWKKFLEGHKIRRKLWDTCRFLLKTDKDDSMSFLTKKEEYLSLEDIEATDWSILSYYEIKYFDIGEAIKRLKCGKKIGCSLLQDDAYFSIDNDTFNTPTVTVSTKFSPKRKLIFSHSLVFSEQFYELNEE